jgi:ribosomal protein S12 methylthiotransferase accessory factor
MTKPTPSLRRLCDALEYLVDPKVGIIRYVIEAPQEAGAPDFFRCFSLACNTHPFSRQANFARAGGASADRGAALAKAVGEAVERYCAAFYDLDELPQFSYRDAPFLCAPPEEFALYSPEQYSRPGFDFVPFGPDTPVRWVPAMDPLTGRTWHVPAAMVFVPYTFNLNAGEMPITQPISTGLACHCSPAEAAASAVCEVIERDAFLITWQARLSTPHIRLETLSPGNLDLIRRFEQAGYSVTLLNITLDLGVPTVLAVARGWAPDVPAITVAASTNLSPEEAVRKSLEELEFTRTFCQKIKSRDPHLIPEVDCGNVKEQRDHLNYWCDHAHAELADFLTASESRVAFPDLESLATGDPARDLQVLLQRVRALNYRVLLADVTTADVGELGLTVIRAIIPGFHPLVVGHHRRALGGSRLWEVPPKLGYPGINRTSGDNPLPHPYP